MKKELLSNFITGIVTFAITVAGSIVYFNFENGTRYVDFKLNTTTNILERIVPQVTMQIDTKPISSIGLVDFEIYNQTDKSLDTLTVHLLLQSKTNKRIGNRLVSHEFKDLKGRTERVKLTGIDSASGSLKLSYTIFPFNKSDDPLLKGSVIIKDIDDIKADIEIKKTGIESRAFKPKEDIFTANAWINVFQIAAGIFTVALVSFSLRTLRNSNSETTNAYVEAMKKNAALSNELENMRAQLEAVRSTLKKK